MKRVMRRSGRRRLTEVDMIRFADTRKELFDLEFTWMGSWCIAMVRGDTGAFHGGVV